MACDQEEKDGEWKARGKMFKKRGPGFLEETVRGRMVCKKCEKKLGTVNTPDTWKDGVRDTTESGGRKLNENKALTSKKSKL